MAVGIKHPDIKHITIVAKNVIIICPVTCSVIDAIRYTKELLINIKIGIVSIKPIMAGPSNFNLNIFIINAAGVATIAIAVNCPSAVEIYELSP
jgi:hypothetical protein